MTQKHPEPRSVRASTTRARIIRAAISEFARHGLRGTTVDSVARRAGVGKGTMYQHFDSKLDLFVAAYEEYIRVPLSIDPDELMKRHQSVEEAAFEICSRLYDRYEKNKSVRKMFLLEGPRLPRAARLRIHQMSIIGSGYVERYIERAQQAGLIVKGDPFLMAQALLGSVFAFHFWHRIVADGIAMPPSGEAAMRAFASIWAQGVTVHPGLTTHATTDSGKVLPSYGTGPDRNPK